MDWRKIFKVLGFAFAVLAMPGGSLLFLAAVARFTMRYPGVKRALLAVSLLGLLMLEGCGGYTLVKTEEYRQLLASIPNNVAYTARPVALPSIRVIGPGCAAVMPMNPVQPPVFWWAGKGKRYIPAREGTGNIAVYTLTKDGDVRTSTNRQVELFGTCHQLRQILCERWGDLPFYPLPRDCEYVLPIKEE